MYDYIEHTTFDTIPHQSHPTYSVHTAREGKCVTIVLQSFRYPTMEGNLIQLLVNYGALVNSCAHWFG